MIILLCQVQLLLREQRYCGKFETAEASASMVRSILDHVHQLLAYHKAEAESKMASFSRDAQTSELLRVLTELQVHHCVLLLLHLVSIGDFYTANLCLPALFEIHASTSSIVPEPNAVQQYEWLPPDVKEELLFYLSCVCNRAIGKLEPAMDYATGALNLVNGTTCSYSFIHSLIRCVC